MSDNTCITVRKADRRDATLILRFIKELADYEGLANSVVCDEETLLETMFAETPSAEALIAELGVEPVGFALYFFNFSTFLGRPGLYVEDVYVHPDFRGRGFGKSLFRELARISLQENCGRMEWAVLEWNEPALKFYQLLGAKPINEWIIHRLDRRGIESLAEMG